MGIYMRASGLARVALATLLTLLLAAAVLPATAGGAAAARLARQRA
jgi:hypothetical protein